MCTRWLGMMRVSGSLSCSDKAQERRSYENLRERSVSEFVVTTCSLRRSNSEKSRFTLPPVFGRDESKGKYKWLKITEMRGRDWDSIPSSYPSQFPVTEKEWDHERKGCKMREKVRYFYIDQTSLLLFLPRLVLS